MVKGTIQQLFNSAMNDAGNDPRKAGQIVANKIQNLLNNSDPSKKVMPEHFNLAQMAHELIPDFDGLRSATAEEFTNAIRSSQFPTISKVVINSAIIDAYNQYQDGADQLVSETDGTRTTEEYIAGFTEPENLELRLEGMSYEETTFGEKDVTVRMADFGRMISITREALYNDRTGQLLNRAKEFGQKGGIHRAKMIIQTLECLPRTAFKEATGASRAFVYKGAAYQHTSFYNASNHTAIDGRTNINLKTSNGLSNWTNLEAVLNAFNLMVDANGDEILVNPNTILVHPTKLATLWQILNSSAVFPVVSKPITADSTGAITPMHTPNPFGPGGAFGNFVPMASRFLSGSGATWYMGDFKKQLVWVWVYRPATSALTASAESAFKNNIALTYKFSYHGGVGNTDYVHVVKNTA